MNQFINGLKSATNKTTTENGAKAFSSTKNYCLDLFAAIGGMRGKDVIPLFAQAYAENKEYASRIALWARDVRHGAGERKLFRDILTYLAKTDWDYAKHILHKVPELGRWDDLLSLYKTPVWTEAKTIIYNGLFINKNALCAKWMPRKGPIAVDLTKSWGLTPKQYRKTLVNLTNTVEQKMCAQQWPEINYSHVPSQASRIYAHAFMRHDTKGYTKYKEELLSGKTKINASATYPYEVIKTLNKDIDIANAQWNALPDFVPEGLSFFPVVDVSGSMSCKVGSTTALDIAISLGLYLSERNKGPYKNNFITFSEKPKLQQVSGTLEARYEQMSYSEWGMNTDINAVFKLILDVATKNHLQQKDLPTHILIVSDMQFDRCTNRTNANDIIKMFNNNGYTAPTLVFWNVNYKGNFPTKETKDNTILISGFSPAIMKTIISNNEINPTLQMLETIMQDRYTYM